jgi:hypothetical protein
MLVDLHSMLTAREQLERDDSFALAHAFVTRAAAKGGVDAPVSKSFPKRRNVRVDIEVIKGRAFMP